MQLSKAVEMEMTNRDVHSKHFINFNSTCRQEPGGESQSPCKRKLDLGVKERDWSFKRTKVNFTVLEKDFVIKCTKHDAT